MINDLIDTQITTAYAHIKFVRRVHIKAFQSIFAGIFQRRADFMQFMLKNFPAGFQVLFPALLTEPGIDFGPARPE